MEGIEDGWLKSAIVVDPELDDPGHCEHRFGTVYWLYPGVGSDKDLCCSSKENLKQRMCRYLEYEKEGEGEGEGEKHPNCSNIHSFVQLTQ